MLTAWNAFPMLGNFFEGRLSFALMRGPTVVVGSSDPVRAATAASRSEWARTRLASPQHPQQREGRRRKASETLSLDSARSNHVHEAQEAGEAMWTYQAFSLWSLPAHGSGRTYPWPTPSLRLRWRETDDAYHAEGKLPEFRRKDLVVQAKGDKIEVCAERERGLFRTERRTFRERIALPEGADPSNIDARFDGGELSIRIAKLPSARRHRIPIHVNGKLPPPTIDAGASRSLSPSWLPQPLRSLFGGATR